MDSQEPLAFQSHFPILYISVVCCLRSLDVLPWWLRGRDGGDC